jgi:hypothetical protein
MTKHIAASIAVSASLSAGIFMLFGRADAQSSVPAADDPVARLAAKLKAGEVRLDAEDGTLGYLLSVLKQLDVNPDSQTLVFSKTSFQSSKISPKAPRAIFFNDAVAVGSVQGGDMLEFIAHSPKEGLVFYTLDATPAPAPKFERRDAVCFNCHGLMNGWVAGLMVNSVFPAADGMPFSTAQFFPIIDHRTPFEQRWGGWYVTGTHGKQEHRGNAIAPDSARPMDLDMTGTQNVTSLAGRFDLSHYLRGSSDVVALMTLEHQTGATNLIARLNVGMRKVLRDGTHLAAAGKKVDSLVDELVAYMLFVDEAPLREPVVGNTAFAGSFAARGPRDSKGRSLRDFDLRTRMFRYPLSYMIYSEAFDGMPNAVRENVYQKLHDVLTGKVSSPKFARLSAEDRRAILEILRETKPNLPGYWRR